MKMNEIERLQQLAGITTEGAYVLRAEEKDMPSKSQVMKMCKDGKTKAEICKMHPDCDQGKLKAMIDDCKKEINEEVNETESNMFTRIMQLAGVHKVTEDDINQPEEAVEESEVSENEDTVDEATEDRVEEATADEQEAVEETKEEVAEDETVEQDVVDEETVAETEQTVEDSDKADLDWLKKVIKY